MTLDLDKNVVLALDSLFVPSRGGWAAIASMVTSAVTPSLSIVGNSIAATTVID